MVAHHALMRGACPNKSADARLVAIMWLKHVDVKVLGARRVSGYLERMGRSTGGRGRSGGIALQSAMMVVVG